MIWECSCGGSIEVPTNFFFHLSVSELDYRCTEKFNVLKGALLNPWACSILSEGEQETKSYTNLDDVEEEEEQEEEWNDIDWSLTGEDDY